MTHRPFKRFIGIDLGGGRGKKTALAVLDRSKGGVIVTALLPRPEEPPLYDAALIAAVRERGEGAAVCVDAPLTLPPCVRCEVTCCPGQPSCTDAEVVALRRLFGMGVGRKGKPAFTPYTQRATEAYLVRTTWNRAARSFGPGDGPTHGARQLSRSRAGRSIHSQ